MHPDRKRNWVLALTSVASLMVALDTLVVSTALTTIREDLGASIEQLEWTVNAYNLSLAVFLLPAAALGDRFGRRLMFTAGLGRVGLVRANAAGWGSVEVVASLGAGALLISAFVAAELRTREPMLPMRFFASRAFSAGNAATFLLFASMFSTVFFLAQFLQTGLGYSPLEAGLRLVPWTATLFVMAPLAGVLGDRIGERPLIVGGLALQAAGLAWIAMLAEPGLAFSELLAPSIVTGIGASMAIPTSANAVVGAVERDEVGKAAGANGLLRELGGVFGIAVAVAVFAGAGGYASAQAFTDGFAPTMAVAAAFSLVGAATGLWVPRRKYVSPKPREEIHSGLQAGPGGGAGN